MITDKIDAITKIPPWYLLSKPPAPRSVKIELSGRCNYRCGFCALRTRESQPKEDMDLEFFKRITLEMKDEGVDEIGVTSPYTATADWNVTLVSHGDAWIEVCLFGLNAQLVEDFNLSTNTGAVTLRRNGDFASN